MRSDISEEQTMSSDISAAQKILTYEKQFPVVVLATPRPIWHARANVLFEGWSLPGRALHGREAAHVTSALSEELVGQAASSH